MQLRFLFVTGMTIGIMAPLIWAAYVAGPTFRATPVRSNSEGGDAARVTKRDAPKPKYFSHSAPTTSSIETGAAAILNGEQPKSDLKSVRGQASSSLDPELGQSMKPKSPQVQDAADVPCDCAQRNNDPDVIDLYVGPHIIIVCSAFTSAEQVRMGCT
jgi:hypothetical protein